MRIIDFLQMQLWDCFHQEFLHWFSLSENMLKFHVAAIAINNLTRYQENLDTKKARKYSWILRNSTHSEDKYKSLWLSLL